LDERAFFTDKPETRPAKYACPRCRRTNDYAIRFVRRVKKDRLPHGADERDRAKFAKLRDHLLRLDDEVTCKTCGKKFEIPSLHSLQFVDQIEGLPKDVEDLDDAPATTPGVPDSPSEAPAAPAASKPPLPARFTRPTKGWRG
jgi:DNA-directed RNA polymerase subunit RPC12/RpoP